MPRTKDVIVCILFVNCFFLNKMFYPLLKAGTRLRWNKLYNLESRDNLQKTFIMALCVLRCLSKFSNRMSSLAFKE